MFFYALIAALILIVFYRFWFLRNPERSIPAGNNIVSPADGKIITVLHFKKAKMYLNKGMTGKVKIFTKDVAEEGWLVSIFMSPLDVHYNRAPISGEIKYVKHFPGRFRLANNPKALFENERSEILIQRNDVRIKVIPIAGFFVRRIVSFVNKKQTVNKGQRIGLIKLGSQCCLVMPKTVKLKVSEGDRVYAGTSIIANIGER